MASDHSEPPMLQRHVAVCAFPFGTHARPLLLLVKRLAAAASGVQFSFFNTKKSNAAIFKDDLLANIVPYDVVPEAEVPDAGHPMMAIDMFLQEATESFRRGMAAAEAEVGAAISCLITDAFLWFCEEIAKEKGVSWVPLWTANAVSLSAHFHTDVIRGKFGILQGTEGREDVVVDCVPGLSTVRVGDLPMGIITGYVDSPFSQMLHKMGLMLPKSTAVVINSFEELTPTITNDLKSKIRLLNVGPFPLTCPPQVESDPHGCLAWLDKQEPQSVAYISFGTVTTPPSQEIIALAEALEASRVPFLWSMNDSTKGHLPPSLVERVNNDDKVGVIVPWAPQLKLLAHCSIGVFITHCGWNSTLESIVTGVPMICRPILGDQMLNRWFIECESKFGIGVEGGSFTKDKLIKALRQVLWSEEGKQMRERVKVLKELAHESVKQGASSYENFNTLIELVTSMDGFI